MKWTKRQLIHSHISYFVCELVFNKANSFMVEEWVDPMHQRLPLGNGVDLRWMSKLGVQKH